MSQISNIPEEIILEILYRLPVKPVAKSRCVSKAWLSILTNPIFIKTHLNKNKNNKTEKLLTIFIPTNTLHSLTLTSQNVYESRKLNFPPHLDNTWLLILGSCDGLVLCRGVDENMLWGLGMYENMFLGLVNPTSSSYLELPKSPLALGVKEHASMHGFGYDDRSDDYKVVKLSPGGSDILVDVYSLKANCWTRLQSSPCYIFTGYRVGVLLQSSIHWVGCTKSSGNLSMIIAFDLSIEQFREIAMPDDASPNLEGIGANLVVLEGCLCVFNGDISIGIDIWMMKEYGVQGSWIKLIRLPSLFNMIGIVVGDHKFIVSCDESTQDFEIYDVKEKRHSMFVVDGDPAPSAHVSIFVESLVSPLIN